MPSVILAAPDDGATATYLVRAMAAEGWRVAGYDYRRVAAAYTHLGARGAMEAANEGLFDLAARTNPDFVLILKGEILWPSTIRRISACGVRTALWNLDPWQQREGWVVERAQAVDRFLTIAKGYLPWFRDQGVHADWLSEACDPEVHKPPEPAASMAAYPVGFVGTIEGVPGRREWWERVQGHFGADAHLWGSFPDGFPSHGRAEPGDAGLAEVVAATAVNLGRDRTPFVERSYGARLYRTLAAGGFLLTNNTRGVLQDFGGCLAVYDSDEECVRLAAEYLDDPAKRWAVAKAGRAKVLAEHTFRHRVRKLERLVRP